MTSAFHRHHVVALADEVFQDALGHWVDREAAPNAALRVADVGGGDGSASRDLFEPVTRPLRVHPLDLDGHDADSIPCDITKPLPANLVETFDIVVSLAAFEHFKDPFTAADNCARLLRPGGLIYVRTLFAWRYHPAPRDYYRFTDDALHYMFEERNQLATWCCGYDTSRRRWDIRGGYFGDADVPPIDDLGGFRENWWVFYVGTKPRSGTVDM